PADVPGRQDQSARRHTGQSRPDEYGAFDRDAFAAARPPPDRIRPDHTGLIKTGPLEPPLGVEIHFEMGRRGPDPGRDQAPREAGLRRADQVLAQSRDEGDDA